MTKSVTLNRFVGYGFMLILLGIAVLALFTFRYQTHIYKGGVIYRYDRWTGKASYTTPHRMWRAYPSKPNPYADLGAKPVDDDSIEQ